MNNFVKSAYFNLPDSCERSGNSSPSTSPERTKKQDEDRSYTDQDAGENQSPAAVQLEIVERAAGKALPQASHHAEGRSERPSESDK